MIDGVPKTIPSIPNIINIGCADDPVDLGDLALHVDIDDWSYKHKYFHQADAHDLPNNWARKFDLVILGDILEHVVDPMKVTDEAARITAVGGYLLFTVFEEWRLPGPGQWIDEAHKLADEENVRMGYKDREDYQSKNYPERIGVADEEETSHLCHINQFTDDEMLDMVRYVLRHGDMRLLEGVKQYEQVQDGHDWYNWLYTFQRIK
jgi:SAM-dependent methyltransferase